MAQIRIGVIGCGQIAQHHFETYSKIPDAQVVACCDIRPAALEASATKWKVETKYENFRDLLKRTDIDAVDVCLHNNYHAPMTIAALEAGKHVYCEKPMAGAYRDAVTMIETAQKLGKKLHIQLSTLYAPETRAARELIAAGELGELYHARSTGFRRRGRPFVDGYGSETFVQKAISAGGALYDMGVYHISQLLYLLGNPTVERVTGKTYQKTPMNETRRKSAGYSVEELGTGFVRFAGDISMDIIEAWAINLDSLEGSSLVGSHGGVRLTPFGFFRGTGELDLNSTVNLESAKFRWQNVTKDWDLYASSQHHWISVLQDKVAPIPTAAIALNTMLIQEGIYLSEKLGREVTADEIREKSVSIAVKL